MTVSNRFFRRFFTFIWFGEVDSYSSKNIVVDEVVEGSPSSNEAFQQKEYYSSQQPLSIDQVRNNLITTITRVVIVVCCVSFCVIVFYALFYPDRSVPDIIQTSFWTTLGWFGGALGAFFQFERNL